VFWPHLLTQQEDERGQWCVNGIAASIIVNLRRDLSAHQVVIVGSGRVHQGMNTVIGGAALMQCACVSTHTHVCKHAVLPFDLTHCIRAVEWQHDKC
jgi:hypothetical protein